MINPGTVLNLCRAKTDNDCIRGWTGQEEKAGGQWLSAGLDQLILSEETGESSETQVNCRRMYSTPVFDRCIEHSQTITTLGPSSLKVHNIFTYDAVLPTLPRVGVTFELPDRFDALEWFGRGPHESYADRKRGARIGRYSITVAGQHVPYILPQENGNKTDTRWFSLSDGTQTLIISADKLFDFSVHNYRAKDLEGCFHQNEVEDITVSKTVVTLDLFQRGLGTASCGSDTLPDYTIVPGKYEFTYYLQLI